MRRIYEWEKWFDARRVTLLRGVHYEVSQSSMVQMIRNNASARNLQLAIEDIGTGIIVEVVGEIPRSDTTPIAVERARALATDDEVEEISARGNAPVPAGQWPEAAAPAAGGYDHAARTAPT